MSDEGKRWEAAVQAAVREAVVGDRSWQDRWGLEVIDTELAGEHPETSLVVRYRFSGEEPTSIAYHLWGEEYAVDSGERTTPEDVAFLIRMDIDSPSSPIGVPYDVS